MSYRYMRVIVFFDLPSVTNEEKREYRKFRKFLIKNGFMMLQESVYCKLALNQTNVKTIKYRLRKNKPKRGLVQIISITEKQFQSMEYIVGEKRSNLLDSDEGVVIL